MPEEPTRPTAGQTVLGKGTGPYQGSLRHVDVIREISANDGMVGQHPDAYFLWGESALRCIRLAVDAVGKREVASILDFPCGHGRVLRNLKAAYPAASLTACDIDRDGVDFCASTFGARSVYSDEDLGDVQLGGGFDLIWVGSLFTHLPHARWPAFLEFLADRLAPEGLLVFTTHGPWYAERIREDASPLPGLPHEAQLAMLRDFDATGFGFAGYPRQNAYGLSLSAPKVVARHLQVLNDIRLVLYLERGWRGYQDVVACQSGFTTPDR
jgi:SAM-dependent methyltransferase